MSIGDGDGGSQEPASRLGSLMSDQRSAWLALAVYAAQNAGAFLKKARGEVVLVTSAKGRDIKLVLDKESEERIVSLLSKGENFPILSEEMGKVWSSEIFPDYHWIVDPLDGTLNYWKDVPLNCVSIGLWRGSLPILGVVYDFNRDELFTGIVGEGAWFNGLPMQVGEVQLPAKAVISTGFPISTDFSGAAIQQFISFVRDYKKVRLLGTAALSLAYVASGRFDAYFERDIKIWDVAAGIAIVEAAGGSSLQFQSTIPNCLTVFSANQSLCRVVSVS